MEEEDIIPEEAEPELIELHKAESLIKDKIRRVKEEKIRQQQMQQEAKQKYVNANVQDFSVLGKYLFRDIPLFKYEFFFYLIIGFVAFIFYVIDKTGIVPGALSKIVLPAILLPMAIWFIKWAVYMPRKKRVPHIHIYGSRVIELGLKDVGKGYITTGKGDNKKRIYITRLNKHTEASTGKPFLITSDLHGENLDLLEETKPDMRSEEFNAILETNTAVTTKNVMNKMLRSVQPTLQNPMFLISMITLFMLAVLLIREFGFLDFIKGG